MTLRDWLDSISTWATGLATVIGTFLIWRELRNRARENEPIIECHLGRRKGAALPISLVVRNRSHAIMTIRRMAIISPGGATMRVEPVHISEEDARKGPLTEVVLDLDVWQLGAERTVMRTGGKRFEDRAAIRSTIHLPSTDWSGRLELALWIESAASSAEPKRFTIRKQVAAT